MTIKAPPKSIPTAPKILFRMVPLYLQLQLSFSPCAESMPSSKVDETILPKTFGHPRHRGRCRHSLSPPWSHCRESLLRLSLCAELRMLQPLDRRSYERSLCQRVRPRNE